MMRQRLTHGATIHHPQCGKLFIRVTHRTDITPSDLWEAVTVEGKLGAPCAYSEQALHRILKQGNPFRPPYQFIYQVQCEGKGE